MNLTSMALVIFSALLLIAIWVRLKIKPTWLLALFFTISVVFVCIISCANAPEPIDYAIKPILAVFVTLLCSLFGIVYSHQEKTKVRSKLTLAQGLCIKRAFDIVASVILLIICLPLLLMTACLIVVLSGWPPIISLPRVGQKGQIFRIYKFRTMIRNAHLKKNEVYHEGRVECGKNPSDPRLTRIGKILRRCALDELPQLWNVIRGDMSIVGPRPRELPEVRGDYKYFQNVELFKPGLTGIPQIHGREGLCISQHDNINGWYIKLWSFRMDLRIICRTFECVIHGHESFIKTGSKN